MPEADSDTGSSNLERQDREPLYRIVPTRGEAPGWIEEADIVCAERAVDRVHDRQFSKSLHDE